MKGQRITSTARGDMRPLAVQGILVPDCYHQVTDILRSRLGEEYARLFAEPVFDEERNSADWYTPLDGVSRRLDEADPETQNAVRERLAAMAQKMRDCARALAPGGEGTRPGNPDAASAPAGRNLAGEILECALQYPQSNCLYLVGDQPVLICWGCGPATPGVEAQDLCRLRPAVTAAPSPPPAAPLAAEGASARPLAAGSATAGTATAGTAAGGGCLPWALALILLLLLLSLLAASFMGKLPAFFSTLSGWGLPVPIMDIQAGEREKEREAALLAEVERLRLAVMERKALCGKSGNSAKPVVRAAPKQELAVPPEASRTGDLSFLKGKWICDSGLADSTGKPVVVIYDFDASGDGSIAIQGPAGICLGKVKSGISKKGVLTIESEPSIPCPDGQSFRGQSIQCRGEDGQTQCRGSNRGSKTEWEAVFSKQ